jgi:diguanylate cyclase (GGDEF)-like protein
MLSTQPSSSALDAMKQRLHAALDDRPVAQILARHLLHAHFQPIVKLVSGEVFAHEGLIRGPEGSSLRAPDALFRAARQDGLAIALEKECLATCLAAWPLQGSTQRLFLNLSGHTLLQWWDQLGEQGLVAALGPVAQLAPSLVIEITEHEHVADVPKLVLAADALRALGLQFALDDFGDGRSSLRQWAELRPEIVKIDKYFIRDIGEHAVKVQTVKGLVRLAETFGTRLVAEGIETEEELRVVRDLGVELGQGYFLGRPQAEAALTLPAEASQALRLQQVSVLPQLTRAVAADFSVEKLLLRVPAAAHNVCVQEVAQWFNREPLLHALALVDAHNRPVGLVHRQTFADRYARPFFKELYDRTPCLPFANTSPLMLEQGTGLDELTAVLTSPDQRYLTEGYIVTEGGAYCGLGTGEQLVRVVTEARIEAARHANPLTFLPGNIPITEHIRRLLGHGVTFAACYADLNDFKPYNDLYGYWRGDEMIRLLARTLLAHAEPSRDFVGHVGGDDFVVLFQSPDWLARCERAVDEFNQRAITLFDDDAQAQGGIHAEDRQGVRRFFPCTRLSIGVVEVLPGHFDQPEKVASAAASAKHAAKMTGRGVVLQG